MKRVQDALNTTGIPVFPNAWKPTVTQPTAPIQYMVYTTMTTEDEHWDDGFQRYRVYVYLNLWSNPDPTEAILEVRASLRASGFALIDERIQASPDEEANQYLVSWTWVVWAEADYQMEGSS